LVRTCTPFMPSGNSFDSYWGHKIYALLKKLMIAGLLIVVLFSPVYLFISGGLLSAEKSFPYALSLTKVNFNNGVVRIDDKTYLAKNADCFKK
jgi:hypothetical protein